MSFKGGKEPNTSEETRRGRYRPSSGVPFASLAFGPLKRVQSLQLTLPATDFGALFLFAFALGLRFAVGFGFSLAISLLGLSLGLCFFARCKQV